MAIPWVTCARFSQCDARGKEAGTLRRAFLVVVLIGLSFGAGAAFNGSGLAWARALIQGRAGIPIAEVDAPTVTDPLEGDGIPSAPVPALASGASSKLPAAPAEQPAAPANPTQAASSPGSGDQAAEPVPPNAPAESSSSGGETPKTAVGSPASETPVDVPAPPLPATPAADSPAGVDPVAGAGESGKKDDIGWGDAPGSAPAAPVVPGRPNNRPRVDVAVSPAGMNTPAERNPGPANNAPSGWTEMRKRLQAQGIARYWIEGEPNGPVRFRCVIPLAGQRAVGQQFEGEGDDEFQAAEAALRRVALWKATEAR